MTTNTTPESFAKPSNPRLPGKHVTELTPEYAATVAARILSRVDRFDPPKGVNLTTPCLRWQGAMHGDGYGLVSISVPGWRNVMGVHRALWLAVKGPIPQGMELDHLCRVKDCVTPAHLEIVTMAENRRRQAEAITHCPQGHEYNAVNTRLYVDARGHRHRNCRVCHRDRARARGARQPVRA